MIISNITVTIRNKVTAVGGKAQAGLPCLVAGLSGLTGKVSATLGGVAVTSFTPIDDSSCAFIAPVSGLLTEGNYTLDIQGVLVTGVTFTH